MNKEERDFLKKTIKEAKSRFKNKTSFENLLFASELLDLESMKYGVDGQHKISIELSKIALELSKLLEEVN